MCMMIIYIVEYSMLLGSYLRLNLANSCDSRVHAPVDILADSLCVTCQYSSILKHKNKHSIMALVKTYSGLRTYLVQTCLPRSFWHNLIWDKQVLKIVYTLQNFDAYIKIYRRVFNSINIHRLFLILEAWNDCLSFYPIKSKIKDKLHF